MSFSYKPLWKLLIDKGLRKEDLRLAIKASPSTLAKMSKNEYVALRVLDDICNYFNCNIRDIIEHEKNKK